MLCIHVIALMSVTAKNIGKTTIIDNEAQATWTIIGLLLGTIIYACFVHLYDHQSAHDYAHLHWTRIIPSYVVLHRKYRYIHVKKVVGQRSNNNAIWISPQYVWAILKYARKLGISSDSILLQTRGGWHNRTRNGYCASGDKVSRM